MTLRKTEQETTIEDLEVIQEVLAGDRNAYAHLVRKYQERVRRHCWMMLGSADPADDAAQEVFIKVYESLGKFQKNSSFSTWIYRVTANHCTDILRKRTRQKTESWDALLESGGEQVEKLFSSSGPDPLSFATTELLAKFLSFLPEESRTVLLLREVEGLSYQEIAETLQCTEDAVKARLKRARRELEEKARHFLRERASN